MNRHCSALFSHLSGWSQLVNSFLFHLLSQEAALREVLSVSKDKTPPHTFTPQQGKVLGPGSSTINTHN